MRVWSWLTNRRTPPPSKKYAKLFYNHGCIEDLGLKIDLKSTYGTTVLYHTVSATPKGQSEEGSFSYMTLPILSHSARHECL